MSRYLRKVRDAGFQAIITAGGIGTRILPFSKEIPKEMSPIIVRNSQGVLEVKPIIQAIFEQLYDFGIRDFFVVVGRRKRTIEDHFTPDQGFIELLTKKGSRTDGLTHFYQRLKSSNLVFVVQPEPAGFGDAVLRARPYIVNKLLVHAGDTFIISRKNDYLRRLAKVHAKYGADMTILLQEVENPEQYGVVVSERLEDDVVTIKKAVEKPSRPPTKTVILPVYLFEKPVFDYLSSVGPGKGHEIQLTDAIQLAIVKRKKVIGVKLRKDELRLDIGTPETLIDALRLSLEYIDNSQKRN